MSEYFNPPKPDVYLREFVSNGIPIKEYSYWDGEVWHLSAPTKELAEHNFKVACGSKSGFQNVPWQFINKSDDADVMWFDGQKVMPAGSGVYYRTPTKNIHVKSLSYFDGKKWYIGGGSVRKAFTSYLDNVESGIQDNWYWRPANPSKQVEVVSV